MTMKHTKQKNKKTQKTHSSKDNDFFEQWYQETKEFYLGLKDRIFPLNII